jgi:hypothetical protein
VTGATETAAQTARFGYLMRNEGGRPTQVPSREIAAFGVDLVPFGQKLPNGGNAGMRPDAVGMGTLYL